MKTQAIYVASRWDADYDYGQSTNLKAFISKEDAEAYAKRFTDIIMAKTNFYKDMYLSDLPYEEKCNWNRKYSALRDFMEVEISEIELLTTY